jgi:putative transposase
MIKNPRHNPAHLFIDNATYFITGAIYRKRSLLLDPFLKKRLLELIHWYFERYQWKLCHWVILNNHYHLLGKSRKGKDMPLIFRGIHSLSGKIILSQTKCFKPVWWNYWDYCPRNEEDFFTRLNYLLYNPVKHGYTNNLNDYAFSSFHNLMMKVGREKLAWQFKEYPDYKTIVLPETVDDY